MDGVRASGQNVPLSLSSAFRNQDGVRNPCSGDAVAAYFSGVTSAPDRAGTTGADQPDQSGTAAHGGEHDGEAVLGNDRGQTSIEYLGIIAVVVAIVLVLSTTDFGSQIANAIANKISDVVGI